MTETTQNQEFWRQKLLAFLHDPPDKAMNILGHKNRARNFMLAAGFSQEEIDAAYQKADWTAAAADRFPFPDYPKSGLKSDFTGGPALPFRHPLGGSDFDGFNPCFSTPSAAEDIFQTVQKGIQLGDIPASDHARANFFVHWRHWPVEAAAQDFRTAFMPADTRIPDHTVWCHNSLVSALQGCFEDGGKPAFLLFQLGPVQEFIAQARSTRDLWSGSYLLSWLTAHAIKAVTDRFGPDHIIFPSLRAIPLFDLLYKDSLYDLARYHGSEGREDSLWQRMNLSPDALLTPALPNRFLALVPAGDRGVNVAKESAKAARDAFKDIAGACWNWFSAEGHPLEDAWRGRFNQQIADFLQVAWQVIPWSEEPARCLVEAYRGLYDTPSPGAEALAAVYDIATRVIPAKGHADDSIIKHGELDSPGFTWSYEYARVSRALDARRQLRDFTQWPADPHGTPKDTLSGKEEIVGNETWWNAVTHKRPFAQYFRSQDRFGAVNLCKKVWHVAHLKKRYGLDVKTALAFDSVPGVAAGQWRLEQLKRVKEDQTFCHYLIQLRDVITEHKDDVAIEIKPPRNGDDLEGWFGRNDPEIFCEATWIEDPHGLPERNIDEVLTLLRESQTLDGKKHRLLPPPPATFAVLALDGDEMGKWIGGENTPELIGQFSKEAQAYFDAIGAKDILGDSRRPVSPSYHLQFSAALANFALYLVRPIVDHFGGQLIYAGGDDVLAMLPASEALRCAQALRAAFRGEKRLCDWVPEAFEVYGTQGGFIKICDPADGQPTWPLIVPGPRADVSVGIAMAHAQSPLQNVVRAAQAAEKRAKNRYGRKAFAVTLYKRSGETIEWGARWDSGALEAYDAFLDCWRGSSDRPKFLSGGFPHALIALLSPYELDVSTTGKRNDIDGFPFAEIIKSELRHVVGRQIDKSKRDDGRLNLFLGKTIAWLDTFCATGQRPLPDFANLFRVAAFLERGA